MGNGDGVLTYDPASRRYRYGTISGAAWHNPAGDEAAMSLVRPVVWGDVEICRDDLSATAQKGLNAILTVFAVSPTAQAEIERQLRP
jgi:type II restriction endonuclease